MPSYTLELELFGTYSADMPGFEIWEDGVLDSSYSISSSGTSISVSIAYGGTVPSSLEFRFNDVSGEGGRSIEIRTVKINNKFVNINNFLSDDSLTQGTSATVDVAEAEFLFDATEPDSSEFTTDPTQTLTAGNDSWRGFQSDEDQVIDALDGRDTIYSGSGNDKINGNDGNDHIRGGAGDDLLFGGAGRDKIYGEDGDDTLYGGDGNDRIQGDAGDDIIHGGAGNDRLSGNAGNDIITGGSGNDKINGGGGTDSLYGDEGNDTIIGGTDADTIDGGADDDVLYGGNGDDVMNGGDGNDFVIGDNGNDTLHGDAGNDTLLGRDGNDTIFGGTGDDFVSGENGNDVIDGGLGDDILVGGSGADTMDGGTGNDVLYGHGLTPAEVRTILNANAGTVFNAETNSFYQYVTTNENHATAKAAAEAAVIGGVNGHLANITSEAENTFVFDLTQDDTSTNFAWIGGNDINAEGEWVFDGGVEAGVQFWQGDQTGGAVNNQYTNFHATNPQGGAGENANIIVVNLAGFNGVWGDQDESTTNFYVIEWDAGLMSDDLAVDTIDGGAGDDLIYGYGGDDVLSGGADNDIIFGGLGNDTINGDAGNDALYGGAGSDTIRGGDGDDVIYADQTQTSTDMRNTLSTEILDDSPILYYKMNETSGTTIINYGSLGSAVDGTISGTYTLGDTAQYLVSGGAVDFEGSSLIDVPDNSSINTSGEYDARTIELVFTADSVTGRQVLYEEGGNGNALNIYLDGSNIYFNGRDAGDWGPFTITTGITAGTTYHAALVLDNANSVLTGYLDGAVVGTGVITKGIASHGGDIGIGNINGSSHMHDGSSSGSSYNFDGRISDVAIYNSVISTTDLQERADIVAQGAATHTNTIHDGDGLDTLYASDEKDIFVFDSDNPTDDTDIIEYFSAGDGDQLDLSDLLTGFVSGTSDIDDFVRLTESGGNTTITVDQNGAVGGENFNNLAVLNGVSGMDVEMMEANNVLIL